MKVYELIRKKERGDLKIAAQIIGIDPSNSRAALRRPSSKYHNKVLAVLTKLIHHRESLANPEYL